jgi:hypothetical protein
MLMEEWRVIQGFDAYEASSIGRVRRVKGGRGARIGSILAPKTHRHGYPVYDLSMYNQVTRLTAARCVALAFHGAAPTSKHQAAHDDGNPTNNTVRNIKWATAVENAADADRHGRRRRGERHQNSKLSENDVRSIRAARQRGVTHAALGKRYGVSASNICAAALGRQWGHVKE